MEDTATNYLGFEVSSTQIRYLFDSIYNPKTEKGLLTQFKDAKHQRDIIEHSLKDAETAATQFFDEMAKKFGNKNDVKRIRTKDIVYNYLDEPLKNLSDELKGMIDYVKTLEEELLVKAHAPVFSATVTSSSGVN